MKRPNYKYFKRAKDLYRSWLNGILRREQLALHETRIQQAAAVKGPVLNLLDKYCLEFGLKTMEDIVNEKAQRSQKTSS